MVEEEAATIEKIQYAISGAKNWILNFLKIERERERKRTSSFIRQYNLIITPTTNDVALHFNILQSRFKIQLKIGNKSKP